MREFLGTGELTESKAFINSFVKEIAVAPGAPPRSATRSRCRGQPLRGGDAEKLPLGGPVLPTVKLGRIWWT
jgi:hypothetical protein